MCHPLRRPGQERRGEDLYFIDRRGDDGFLNRPVLKLKTPTVLRVAREQFGCPALEGVRATNQMRRHTRCHTDTTAWDRPVGRT